MPSSEELVHQLSDQEVVGLLDVVVSEFAAESTPEGEAEQIAALASVLPGGAPTLAELDRADDAALTAAARRLVVLLHEADETRAAVDREAADPPHPENAAAQHRIAMALVLTACIVVLQV